MTRGTTGCRMSGVGCRPSRAEAGAEFGSIKVSTEARGAVSQEPLIHSLHHCLLIFTDASINWKDRQHTTFVTLHAIVIAVTEFPAPLHRHRTIAPIGSEVVFEVGIRRLFGTRNHSDY